MAYVKRALMTLTVLSGLAGTHIAHAQPVRSHMDVHETADHANHKHVHKDKKAESIDQKQEEYEQKYAIPQDRGADLPK